MILFLKYTHALHTLHTLETPVREALLKPRNFNPHPYPQYRTSAAINIDINTIESLSDEYGDNSIYNIDDGSIGTELSQRQVPANGIYSQGPVQFPPSAPASINRNNNNLNYNFQQLPNPYATLKLKGEINRPNRINKIDHVISHLILEIKFHPIYLNIFILGFFSIIAQKTVFILIRCT